MLLLGIFAAFADGVRDFAGFAETDADFARFVTNDNQCAEAKTASALDDFGRTVDEDNLSQ